MLFWPPSSFTVDLTSSVRDGAGKQIASVRVIGTGSAETPERLADYGVAGKRAMEAALSKMQTSLIDANLQSTSAGARPARPQGTSNATNTSARLAELKELRDKGQISQEEYESKRRLILESL